MDADNMRDPDENPRIAAMQRRFLQPPTYGRQPRPFISPVENQPYQPMPGGPSIAPVNDFPMKPMPPGPGLGAPINEFPVKPLPPTPPSGGFGIGQGPPPVGVNNIDSMNPIMGPMPGEQSGTPRPFPQPGPSMGPPQQGAPWDNWQNQVPKPVPPGPTGPQNWRELGGS